MWPIGGMPPIDEAGQLLRLARRRPADVALAGDRGQPGQVDAVRAADTRQSIGSSAPSSSERTNTSDLTIWPSSAPTAAAASSAVWVDSSKIADVERHALPGGGVADALDRGMVGRLGHGRSLRHRATAPVAARQPEIALAIG